MLRKRATKRNNIMMRMGVFVFGAFIACEGIALLNRGVFAYRNYYRAEVHSPALSALGVLLMIVALLPNSFV